MSYLEIAGFASGLICVYLNTRQNILGWPIAMVSVITYAVVFFENKLYGDMGLQIFFFAITGWGWYQWARGQGHTSVLAVSYSSIPVLIGSIAATVILSFVLFFLLDQYTDTDLPLWDAITTALSIVAQILMGRKKIENWIFWIVADVIYVGIYLFKELHLTAVLYLIYVPLAWYGYNAWKHSYKSPTLN